jgi:23S rRNA pseudouridine1911/1915/1917 synthase
MIKHSFVVSKAEAGQRLDQLCAQKFPKCSRNQWQKQGKFSCDGVAKTHKIRAKKGESWNVSCALNKPLSYIPEPWDYPLEILAESKTWVVINKPIGISVHDSPSEQSGKTIVNALIHRFGEHLSENTAEIDGQSIPRPGLVHRLDKSTSGTLLVAKTGETHRYLQSHWNKVQKTYYAIVTGTPPPRGRIESGILRDPQFRQRMAVSNDPKAREAITEFETLVRENNQALLKINLLTGRTHQIRVHLSSLGIPVLGDQLYGGEPASRIFLHAHQLDFPDPDNGGKKQSIAAPLPGSFLLQP